MMHDDSLNSMQKMMIIPFLVKRFTCELCGISYCHREGLSRHLQTAHSDNWSHRCEVCGMTFKIKNGLYEHRKRHTEFQHKCNQCGKAFRKRISLRRHLEDHTGSVVKPFACDFCGKSFRLKFNLVVRTFRIWNWNTQSGVWVILFSRFDSQIGTSTYSYRWKTTYLCSLSIDISHNFELL